MAGTRTMVLDALAGLSVRTVDGQLVVFVASEEGDESAERRDLRTPKRPPSPADMMRRKQPSRRNINRLDTSSVAR